MNEAISYKKVPVELLDLAKQRDPRANIDPMLCGYRALLEKFKIPKTGIVHIGGHIGQELPMYAALGFQHVVMVEPLLVEFSILKERVNQYNEIGRKMASFLGGDFVMKACAFQYAVSDTAGPTQFYHTEVSSLSSLSKPIDRGFYGGKKHVAYKEVTVPCVTLDSLMVDLPAEWQTPKFDYLRMNVQGSELKILKSSRAFLESISFIDLEINIDIRYEENPTKSELDSFLLLKGFTPVFEYISGNSVGNVIYARKS